MPVPEHLKPPMNENLCTATRLLNLIGGLQNYDPPRDLSALMTEHTVDHVFLNKLSTYKQLRELSRKRYDIFVNLCEGYLEWEVPSIDVIWFLEQFNLPTPGQMPCYMIHRKN